MTPVDEAKALAAGYSAEDIAAENKRRSHEDAERVTRAQDYKLRKEGGSLGFGSNLAAGAGKALTDTALGAQQGLAALGFGDKQALAQEAAEKEALDAPLMATGGGKVGKFGTDIAASFLPAGAATKSMAMLPKLYKGGSTFLRGAETVGRGMAAGAGAGAASEVLTPEEDYSLSGQAGKGAAFGAGGDVVGRVAGRLYAPFRNTGAGATARENAALLNREGLPRQIPATQTDDRMVQAATNALEQLPLVGRGVRGARNENLEFLTRQNTAPTGVSELGYPRGRTGGPPATGVAELTPSARTRMVDELDNIGNQFRTQDKIVMSPVAADAKQAVANVQQYARDTAQLGAAEKLTRSAKSIADRQVPIGPMPAGVPAPPPGVGGRGPTRTVPQERTAAEVMDLRNAAGKLAHETTDPVLRQQYRAYRESLADRLRDLHGEERFNDWLKQWGAMEDVMHAAGGKGGKELKGGKLTPERLVANIDESVTKPLSRTEQLNAAFAGNIPSPPAGWNRAMIQALLLGGSPVALGGISDVMQGDAGLGTGLGAATSAAMVAGLSRKVPSQKRIDALRKALTVGGIAAGRQF